jgi:hypothetical protein
LSAWLAIGGYSHAPPRGSSVTAMDDPSLRVSDADREQAVVVLREHLLAGRLTLEEFSERVEAALRARLGGELARVQDDLPEVLVETAGSRRRPVRFTTALLGHVVRRGRLRLRGWAIAASAFGDLGSGGRRAAAATLGPTSLTRREREAVRRQRRQRHALQ